MGLFKKYYSYLKVVPLWNWIRVIENENTGYLIISDDYDKIKPTRKSNKLFDEIYADYFDRFCVTDKLKEYMREDRAIVLEEIKAVLKNDRTFITLMKIKKQKFEDKYKNLDRKVGFVEIIGLLEQEVKIIIDEKKITAEKFYTHIRIQSEKNEKIRQWQSKSRQQTS